MVQTRWLPKFINNELPNHLDGKVFVITGTTSGTGYVAAKVTAQLGGEAVLLNRASSRVPTMMKKLQEEVPNGKFVSIECDLQDFSSVRKAIEEVKSRYTHIYCLSNNAGIMATPDRATVDGYDTQMQTNHLSHFLLTAELYPLLEAGADVYGDARIVNHSSIGRFFTPNKGLEEKYFGPNGGKLGGDEVKMMAGPCFHRYFQTKLANSVFTHALDEKLKAKNSKVRAVAAHPGGSDTNLSDHLQFQSRITNALMATVLRKMLQTSEDGTMGLLKGMMHPDAKSGALYGPNGMKGKAIAAKPKKYENDPAAMGMLWRTSEEATGIKFEI